MIRGCKLVEIDRGGRGRERSDLGNNFSISNAATYSPSPSISTTMRATSPSLLKLFALPLSRSSPSHPPLFYLHASRTRSTLPPPNTASSSSTPSNEAPKLPLLTKATDKAADMWSGLGKGKEGGWKKRSYVILFKSLSLHSFTLDRIQLTSASHVGFRRENDGQDRV